MVVDKKLWKAERLEWLKAARDGAKPKRGPGQGALPKGAAGGWRCILVVLGNPRPTILI